jgi:hypothetical protein
MNDYIIGANNLVDVEDLIKFLARLLINIAFATVVIRLVYFRIHRDRGYVFTFYAFNIITFCMCLMLRKVPIELGFALGLFAVFGILRYRTEAIRTTDLTYLFIVIGLGILNGVANKKISVVELMVVNLVIVLVPLILERGWRGEREVSQLVFYDNVELLKPSNERELYEDLQQRIGAKIARIQIGRIDFLRDAAEITVHYKAES